MDPTLKRINELAKIAKERQLTEEEIEERLDLRAKYLANFRQGFRQTLLNTKVVDKEGNDVTPEKLKRQQNRENKDK